MLTNRMNKNALIAMVALIGVAIWLVAGDDGEPVPLREGATSAVLRVGTLRGVLEREPTSETFRVVFPGHAEPAILSRQEAERVYGAEVLEALFEEPANWLFRVFNITGWGSMVWSAVGLIGQIAFFLRMFVQWIASERKRESVVPESFWWLSLGGGVALFSYFVWRKDLIGALGQTTGVVVYARNLRLIQKGKARRASGA
jgi:lipid-A-disaccharide synthase-like uncharacterized protein